MLGREANRRPQKQVASSLEIQIWSAVNCHSRGWTVIHRLCPPPVNRGGGEEKEEESSSNRTIPGGSLLNHDCQWRNPRPAGGGANRDGNSWNVVLLYFFARVPPPSPPLVQTIPYFRTGGISTGQNRWGSWEAYAVFVLTIRSARSCFETSRDETTLREFTAAGCECLLSP